MYDEGCICNFQGWSRKSPRFSWRLNWELNAEKSIWVQGIPGHWSAGQVPKAGVPLTPALGCPGLPEGQCTQRVPGASGEVEEKSKCYVRSESWSERPGYCQPSKRFLFYSQWGWKLRENFLRSLVRVGGYWRVRRITWYDSSFKGRARLLCREQTAGQRCRKGEAS